MLWIEFMSKQNKTQLQAGQQLPESGKGNDLQKGIKKLFMVANIFIMVVTTQLHIPNSPKCTSRTGEYVNYTSVKLKRNITRLQEIKIVIVLAYHFIRNK